MEKKLNLINDIFESELAADDQEKDIEEVLQWNSFYIMQFLVEIEEQFGKRISIEQISEVSKVSDLLQLIENE